MNAPGNPKFRTDEEIIKELTKILEEDDAARDQPSGGIAIHAKTVNLNIYLSAPPQAQPTERPKKARSQSGSKS